jgi:hypothetical protein
MMQWMHSVFAFTADELGPMLPHMYTLAAQGIGFGVGGVTRADLDFAWLMRTLIVAATTADRLALARWYDAAYGLSADELQALCGWNAVFGCVRVPVCEQRSAWC